MVFFSSSLYLHSEFCLLTPEFFPSVILRLDRGIHPFLSQPHPALPRGQSPNPTLPRRGSGMPDPKQRSSRNHARRRAGHARTEICG